MEKWKIVDVPEETKCCRLPLRHVVTLMGFLGFFNLYAMRVNLSVALVAMVNVTASAGNTTGNSVECSALAGTESAHINSPNGGQYNWDSKEQSVILGAFFYGYIVTQLPGGYLAEKFGAKWLYGGGVLVTAVLSLLTPLAAAWGTTPFIIVRVLEGFGEGVTMPAINALISRWSPKFERSRMTTIVFTGCHIGNVVAMPISGILSSSEVLGGWPSVFYVFGTIGCLWFILWAFLIHDSPAQHPRITKEELFYIQEGLGEENPHQNKSVPWKEIFTSVPLWALALTHFGQSFGYLMLLTELPTFLSNVLHFNLKENGVLSAAPYLAMAICAWFAAFLADLIRKSGRLQNTTIRKIANSIGLFGPAACMLGVTVSGCRPSLIVALITLGMAFNGFQYSGLNVTHVDMSPDFAGTLYGITNTVGNVCGILAPAVVGFFTSTGETFKNWNYIFYITAGIYVVAALVYIFFASAELQPWGIASETTITEKPKNDKSPSSGDVNISLELKR